jgi:DTW domain-containing protein YfiP
MSDGEAWDAPPPLDAEDSAQEAPAAEPRRGASRCAAASPLPPALTRGVLRAAALCARCHRPAPRECVCAALPPLPLDTLGCVVLVQHPHEQRRAFATVPLLQAALGNCWVRFVSRPRAWRSGWGAALTRAPLAQVVRARAHAPRRFVR